MARRSKAPLLSAVSFAALVGLAPWGAKLATEWELARLAHQAGATVADISADPFTGRVTLGGLILPVGTGRLAVGKVALGGGFALFPPAQAAEDVTLENVTLTFGPATYRIARVEVAGSSLDRAGVQAIFDGSSSTEPLGARLAKLSASSVTMPDVEFEQSLTFGSVTTTSKGRYENVVARDVVNGRAALITAARASTTTVTEGGAKPANGEQTSAEKPAETAATMGAFEVHDVDMAFLVRQYTEGAGTGPNPPVRVYGPFKLSGISQITRQESQDISKVEISEISGDGFTGHLSEKPWLSLIENLKREFDDANAPGSDQPDQAFDILHSLGDMVSSIDSGAAAIKGISVEQIMPQPIKFQIGAFEMGFSREAPAQGASPLYPAQGGVRFAFDKIAFSLPQDAKADMTQRLIAMGYKDLSLSLAIEGRLNEAGEELVINDFSLSGENMGKATVSALLGNVTDDLLSTDEAVRQTAIMGLTAKNLAITMENGGFFDRLFSELAAQQNKTPDALKTEYSMIAMVGVPGFLGGSANSKALGSAIARFIAKPGELDIKAVAKDPAGFGLADYGATGGRPADILEQLEISAEAK
jgi:hypothetical protein